ncbi:MAG: hypothetical protein EBW52_12575, partial [Betaproteobacteria bacterium]|nr:hypothetical protein [Betaproteobacteria bacterium]
MMKTSSLAVGSQVVATCWYSLVATFEFRRDRMLLALFALSFGLAGSAGAQDRNPILPQIELRAGMHKIVAEVASSD